MNRAPRGVNLSSDLNKRSLAKVTARFQNSHLFLLAIWHVAAYAGLATFDDEKMIANCALTNDTLASFVLLLLQAINDFAQFFFGIRF